MNTQMGGVQPAKGRFAAFLCSVMESSLSTLPTVMARLRAISRSLLSATCASGLISVGAGDIIIILGAAVPLALLWSVFPFTFGTFRFLVPKGAYPGNRPPVGEGGGSSGRYLARELEFAAAGRSDADLDTAALYTHVPLMRGCGSQFSLLLLLVPSGEGTLRLIERLRPTHRFFSTRTPGSVKATLGLFAFKLKFGLVGENGGGDLGDLGKGDLE